MKKFKLMLLVSMLFLLLSGCSNADPWPENGLLSVLPVSNTEEWELNYELEDSASAMLLEAERKHYDEYLALCEEAGFTIDVRATEDTYLAFNEEGYWLNLYYVSLKEQIDITLYAPTENAPITWPSEGLGALLPAPSSGTGEIILDSETLFTASITNISEEAFVEYANACVDAGFSTVSGQDEIHLAASNENLVTLRLDYIGFNTMNITVSGAVSTAE